MVIIKNGRIPFVWWYYSMRVAICVMVVMISAGCKSLVSQSVDLQKGYSLFSSVCEYLPKGIKTPERGDARISAIRKLLEYERKPALRPDKMSMNALGIKDRETLLMIKQDFCLHPGNPAIAERGLFFEIVDGYIGLVAALFADKISGLAVEPLLALLPDITPSLGESADYPIPSVERENTLQLVDSLISVTYHPDRKTVDIYYGTTRQRSNENPGKHPNRGYTDRPGEGLSYGICSVSIPDEHAIGNVERPSRKSQAEDSKKHMTMPSVTEMSAQEFSDQLKQSHSREAFVYIHGVLNTFQDACLRAGQISYDLKFKGAPIMFSWPAHSDTMNPLFYMQDQQAIDRSTEDLKKFIELVANAGPIDTMHLIAHSLGNRGLIRAARELKNTNDPKPVREHRFQELVLVAPDFDTAWFKKIAQEIKESANRVTIYASSKDWALELARRVNDGDRLGEAGPKLFLRDGMDTIDASNVDSDLGHSPHHSPNVVADIRELLTGKTASDRTFVRAKVDERWNLPYYYFLPITNRYD